MRLVLAALALALFSTATAAQEVTCPAGDRVHPSPRLTADELCDLLRRARASHTDQLLVLEGGQVRAERTAPGAPERIHVMSVTKSVVALAVGRLLLEGRLEGLDTPVHAFFPEWRQGRKADITVRHLLTHTSGLQNVPNAGEEIEPAPDMVQLALAAELEAEPGAAFEYNNKAVNLLGAIVEKASGRPLDRYLEETVFREVGITDYTWIRDPAGHPVSMAGLSLSARDLARLGRLVLQEGRWKGRTVVDPHFAREAVRPQHDLHPRHGLLWWLLPRGGEGADEAGGGTARSAADGPGAVRGFYADGWLGQWLVVVPEAELVAVRLIDRSSWTGEEDGFRDFPTLVLERAGPG